MLVFIGGNDRLTIQFDPYLNYFPNYIYMNPTPNYYEGCNGIITRRVGLSAVDLSYRQIGRYYLH